MRSSSVIQILLLLQSGMMIYAAAATAQQGSDTAFAALQERGRAAMGVDQYASKHLFDDLPDGGRVVLRQSSPDSAGVRAIRDHLSGIARAFATGDFRIPGVVHAGVVPGTVTMAAKRDLIRYQFRPLAGGGEVRLTTHDPEALHAIREFMRFQRREHRSGGRHEH